MVRQAEKKLKFRVTVREHHKAKGVIEKKMELLNGK
jgi:hypothetical protein